MWTRLLLPTLAGLAGLALPSLLPGSPTGPARVQEDGAAEMAAMMAKMKQYTAPGEHHALLERFLGRWETKTRITMAGAATEPEVGSSEFSWLMEGRWLQSHSRGTMMGMPAESFVLMGYDNFKQSYVVTTVQSLDTAMLRSEGDLTREGDALITYGTLDEYLTGEHDKMVKYVWRFLSDDEIVMEVHDLPIGEEHTQVIEVRFERAE